MAQEVKEYDDLDAAGQDAALAQDWLWSTVAFTIVLSVFVHGILASPVMKRIGVETG